MIAIVRFTTLMNGYSGNPDRAQRLLFLALLFFPADFLPDFLADFLPGFAADFFAVFFPTVPAVFFLAAVFFVLFPALLFAELLLDFLVVDFFGARCGVLAAF